MPARRRRRRAQRVQQRPIGDIIRESYRTPGHPTAYSSPGTVARFHNVSVATARKYLEEEDAYNLHREYKRARHFNPYFVYRRRKLIQADLIDVGRLAVSNDGIKFLLLIIDVFSRRVWLYPIKNKSASTMESVLRRWLDSLTGKVPETLMTDKGTEFFNRRVQALLDSRDVELKLATGTCKASYAERANKSIQILIYKYLTDRETHRYIDKLEQLVQSYNNRPHRSLEGISPFDADKVRNRIMIRDIAMRRWSQIPVKKPKLQLGDMVRIKTENKGLSDGRRAYAVQYQGEYFTITRINRRLPIPMYYIKSMDTGEHIDGAFYSNELSRVRGDVFKVERVLRYRRRGRNRQALVRWRHFGPQHDSWIAANQVVERY